MTRGRSSVDVARKADVITLTLRLGSGRLDPDVHVALAEACGMIDLDDDVRAVVVKSAGKDFCVGDDETVTADARDGIEAIGRLRVPCVAVLAGDALGAGLELALACDLRIAASGAKLGLPQTGAIPFHGGTQRLPRIVGAARAARMLLLGETWSARQAKEAGLLQIVSKRTDLAADLRKLVATLSARAPIAQRLAKEALRSAADLPLAEGLRLEGDLYVLLHTTRDRDEGIASFHQKRQPRFQGR
ncbi:MAG: enoyl-CoA hydratase-related protein [Candidatus Binatia bacterium]|nr:enoyl-CoA hydratase-related protein [Candidatus Binatia bacterium]